MDDAVEDLVKKGKAPGGMINLDDAIDAAAKSHVEAFPLSGCSKKCIKVQLEGYYKNTCPNGSVKAIDKKAGSISWPKEIKLFQYNYWS